MKGIHLTTFLLFLVITTFGQDTAIKGFVNFNEFKDNKPSLTLNYQLKKRTVGDIFMTGGISNYRLKKMKTNSEIDRVEKELWGISFNDTMYINSYPYSKLKGYNQIIEKGYFTYFIGEPARTVNEQRELGIIKPTEKQIPVCCQTGYVMLPDGTIKLLSPELLLELCNDNEDLAKEIKGSDLKLEDVYKMFDFLKKYNLAKK